MIDSKQLKNRLLIEITQKYPNYLLYIFDIYLKQVLSKQKNVTS